MENEMNNFDEIQKAWDDVYTEHGQDVPWATKANCDCAVPLIVDYVKRNKLTPQSLLDYGTGTGHMAIAIKEQLGIPRIIAADITDKGVDKKLLKRLSIDFVRANQPKDVGGKHDLILCWGVFHHVGPELSQEFLTQFADMLNDNGTLLAASFSPNDKYLAGQEKKRSAYSGLQSYVVSNFEDEQVLKRIGLKAVEKGDTVLLLNQKHQAIQTVPDRLIRYCLLSPTRVREIDAKN